MYVRDAAGIATTDCPAAAGAVGRLLHRLRRPPVLRWPGFLELTIESECPDWVVYTEPVDAMCVEPQTAPPDALNGEPGHRRAGAPAGRRDDLALETARRLTGQLPGVVMPP